MPTNKKDSKKEKPKSQVKSETSSKKDPKFLTSQVEEKIKALAKNKPVEKVEDKEAKDEKKEMHITHEEETKKVTKDTASIVSADQNSEEVEEPSIQKEDKEDEVVSEVANNTDSDTAVIKEEPQEQTENVQQESDEGVPVVQSESLFTRSLAPIIIGIVVGILTAGSIIFFYNRQTDGGVGSITPTPSVVENPTVTPTPTSVIDELTLYDITILNGSGISGEAASLENTLQEEGFSVLDVGNAANSNFTTTIIQAKEGVPSSFIGQLQQVLSENYQVEINSVALPESEESDVVITIGSLEAQESSQSATPTP